MIDYLNARIVPVMYGGGFRELTTSVFFNGKEYHFRRVYHEEELKSLFEYIWESLGRDVLEVIKNDTHDHRSS